MSTSEKRTRSRLSAAKHRLVDVLTVTPFVRGFEWLPRRQAAQILERVQLQGTLDYPSANILMETESTYQVSRLRSCVKEPETVQWIERELKKKDVFYDIGANVGAYSLVANAVASGCRVYAYEPSFATFAALCRNIRLNSCADRVIPLPLALSDHTGLVPFNYYSIAVGAALHTSGDAIDYKGEPFDPEFAIPTMTYRLVDLIAEFKLLEPTHIKIDVDGNELLVLRGAGKSLESVRSILVEIQEGSSRARELEEYLASFGLVRRAAYPVSTPGFANIEFHRTNG